MTSRLTQMQARFQQKQMQEKEEKLLRLYENQQQRTIERVGRGSAGSNTTTTTTTNNNGSSSSTRIERKVVVTSSTSGGVGGGKVRQMFDERRQKAGVDKSYPLEPLRNKNTTDRKNTTTPTRTTNNTNTTTSFRSTIQKNVSHVKNGKSVVNKRQTVQTMYDNNNGNETFEQRTTERDNSKKNSHENIVDLMNNQNLNETLDNEEMPRLGFDEVDDVVKDTNQTIVETRTKKEPQAVGKKSPKNSSNSLKMSTVPKSGMQPSKATVVSSARAPTNTRPSARQVAKSAVARDDLSECKFCGRRFATDRLGKHEDICARTGKKKRKTYDATKHRVVGTELETYVLRGKGRSALNNNNKAASRPPPKKDWRRTHEEFISTIRAAKQAQAYVAKGGKLSDLPPPPPSSNPDYVQCPHCGRRFNQAAADRHIPKCANFQFNKPKGAKR